MLARAADAGRTVATENASDFLPLLDHRQSVELSTTPVLVALTAGRGVAARSMLGSPTHRRLGTDNPDPYTHAHWLP